MSRKRNENPEHRALGDLQGSIDRSSGGRRPRAVNHNLGRNIRVLQVLAYLANMIQTGRRLSGRVRCLKARQQNFSSTGEQEAAHFLPGQILVGGRPLWDFAPTYKERTALQFIFGEVEHLPVAFNQADREAEANGKPYGLCAAFANACAAMINPQFRGALREQSNSSEGARPHPDAPAAKSFDWTSAGPVHPDAPASRSYDWSALSFPHPDSPAGRAYLWSERGQPIPRELVPAADLVKIGYQVWSKAAIAALGRALDAKSSRPMPPPLEGDRFFEGYTAENVSARGPANRSLWNVEDAADVLKDYLEDQLGRDWNWAATKLNNILWEAARGIV
jgi:hypothetical protein